MEKNKSDFTLALEFYGPFKLCGTEGKLLFDQEMARLEGVYLWTVRFRDGFLINYVGETGTSFYRRMKDHMIQSLGGNYRICDAEQLLKGRKEILWNGMWRKGTRDLMPVFVDEKYVELAPRIRNFLRVLDIFIAPIETDRRTRRRIEGAIAFSLREQADPVGSIVTEDVRYTGRKQGETPIQVTIASSAELFGLDRKLLV
jgi:hypothetical protein